MKKAHFVTFYSPGTFVSEETTLPIKSWDVKLAMTMAHGIVERYGATPYGFTFSPRGRGERDLDSKVIKKGQFFWLGGRIETLEQIEARNDPKEEILRSNMRSNRVAKIVINDNSWRFTGEFKDREHVMLDWKPRKRRKKAA